MSLIIKKKNRLKKLIIGKGLSNKSSVLGGSGNSSSVTNSNNSGNSQGIFTGNNPSNPFGFWQDDDEEEELDMAAMVERAIIAKLNVALNLRQNYNFANLDYILTFKINPKTKEKMMKDLYIRRSHDKINTVISNREFSALGIRWDEVESFLISHNSRRLDVQKFFETVK
jgi:hypothetical protein